MTAGGTGMLDVDGRPASLGAPAGGWLSAEMPLAGEAVALLRLQGAIPTPAKIGTGPSLRAELPTRGAPEPTMAALRAALRAGLAALAGGPPASATDAGERARAEAGARALLATHGPSARGWAPARDGAGWSCTIEIGRRPQPALVRVDGGCVRFAADLGQVGDLHPVAARALVHFLLALNSRLLLARATLGGPGVSLEVVLPAPELDERMIHQALDALAIGAAVAKRECAALAEPAFAAQYCAFHHSTPQEDRR